MNVFILNTGRCGSVTFIKACQHITNFTSAHESRNGMLGDARFAYPENHIEADNRLSWFLGKLDKYYGNNAIYVHLKRNKHDTANSFARRYSGGIIAAYRTSILMGLQAHSDPMSVALDYCDTVNCNIVLFLKDKHRKIDFSLENAEQSFAKFWDMIGAEGDMGAALSEFNISYHASGKKKRKRLARILRKVGRAVKELPAFTRNTR